MTPDADNAAFFAELIQAAQEGVTPKLLLNQHLQVKQILTNSNRMETAAFFGALLLDPSLQSNCVRLEALVHLAVSAANGAELPSAGQLATCFNDLGSGICGRMEDPAEDVFVSVVVTPRGNFRVLEGIWESGAFYLQRFMNILETTPDEGDFLMLRRRVYALLRLSEAVCKRAGLVRNSVGEDTPKDRVCKTYCSTVDRRLIFFDLGDLEELGLTTGDLDIFILDDQVRPHLLTAPVTKSPLQECPLVRFGEQLALVLPTAISYALRTAIVDFLLAGHFQESFHVNLGREYAAFFHSEQLLGSFFGAPIMFCDKGLPVAELLKEADEGRYFHFLFFLDTLDEFYETGVAGIDSTPGANTELFSERIRAAVHHARAQRGFRNGVTLLVNCGIGRGCALPVPEPGHEGWNVLSISAPDLTTLSCTKEFDALKLWKVLRATRRLSELGVEIQNINGLLNLIGWVESNEGHVVAHSTMPKELRRSHGTLMIAPNFLLELRANAATQTDRLGVPAVDGTIVKMRRLHESFFPEDNAAPLYVPEGEPRDRGIRFAYLSAQRAWWCEVFETDSNGDGLYERGLMLRTWLTRIVPSIEARLDQSLPSTILLRVEFQRASCEEHSGAAPSRAEIEASIETFVDREGRTVTVRVDEQFDLGLSSPANISETALVMVICKGIAELAEVDVVNLDLATIEQEIVGSDDARHMHAFQAREFREFVHSDLSGRFIRLDESDSADLLLGLAFRVEDRERGRASIRSKLQSTRLLNALVRNLEDELCSELRQFDRATFVAMALRNHEQAVIDRKRWARTARANLALHQDKESALEVITDHDMQLNAVVFPSRVLVELAVCECPIEGGLRPGYVDFSKLMAKVNAISHLGGWSDAIHLDAMPPRLSITPLGDVQALTDFQSHVLMPFSQNRSEMRIESAMQEYDNNFKPPKVYKTLDESFDKEFLEAWKEEFGITLNDMRRCVDAFEDLGITRTSAVFRASRSELIQVLQENVHADTANAAIVALGLVPRETWRTIPDGFHEKDIQPWRFRRQLSSVRRPLIQLTLGDDPEFIVAPGFIRDSFGYLVNSYFEGSFPDRHYKTKAMRRWHGKRKNERGRDFTALVADKIRELGWKADKEIEVKTLIGRGKDLVHGDLRRFGDVDVVAWNEEANRLLILECKHLQYMKTYGEVAEQLSDYRGRVKRDGSRDDLLKHLDRLEVLNSRKSALCHKLKLNPMIKVEGWILFKHPVPMLYFWAEFEDKVSIATFDDLERIVTA